MALNKCQLWRVHRSVAVQLEKHLGKSLLQFACHHHVAELWIGAECRIHYGKTILPDESCFKALRSCWSKVDVENYKLDTGPLPERASVNSCSVSGRIFGKSNRNSPT